MKIIISPSKTQTINILESMPIKESYFTKETNELVKWIKSLDKSFLAEKMKIKGELLEDTIEHYKHFSSSGLGHAIISYTGTVFKQLTVAEYTSEELDYMSRHLCVLSALYGVLEPFSGIAEYRLDMKMGIYKSSLYSFWKIKMEAYFTSETIISLASAEYDQMIPKSEKIQLIRIDFKEQVNEKYKSVGYYSKVARGKMLNELIRLQLEELDKIKTITFDGYTFNKDISTHRQWYFTRKTK
jgi:cytoplasmic iron level regulating protein YaaA (DUF328/UPF0246 family)